MNKLVVICEGKTEVRLLENLLYSKLEHWFYPIIPITLPTGENPGGGTAKGGFHSSDGYSFALKHIIYTLKLHVDGVITTFFDLYGFPTDIPCYKDAGAILNTIERAGIYERQMLLDVAERKIDGRFIPYVQPCESEAFLFVDPCLSALEMGNNDTDVERIKAKMTDIRTQYSSPEYINADKGPSMHLEEIIAGYRKNKVGKSGFSWKAAKEIGIEAICAECTHFNEWIQKLGTLHNRCLD